MNEQLPKVFLTSCGLAEAPVLLVNRVGEMRARRYQLKYPFAVVGAHPRATLQLIDPEVQRKHAFLQIIAGNLFCLALGSQAGTHWPDGPRPAGWLQPGEPVTIGPFQIRLDDSQLAPLGPKNDNPLEKRFAPLTQDGDILLEFCAGQQKVGRCRLSRQLTLVGRASLCRIRLAFASVSAFHASLLQNAQGLWAVDLLSREGIQVNGERRRWARLAEGDRLQVGEIEVRVGRAAFLEQQMENEQGGQTFLLPSSGPSAVDLPTAPLPLEPQLLPVPVPVPAAPSQSVVSTAVLGQVLQHLSLMQQQTLDQFHEQMQMVVRTFEGLYRDRHDELDHLQSVTKELQGLQEVLAKSQSGGVAAPLPPSPQAVGNGSRPPPAPIQPPPSRPMPVGTEQPAAPVPAGGPPTEAIHSWLNERIATLQQERQTCWQKIMHSLGL